MDIVNLIFGKPLKSSEERAEQIGPAEGIPIFGLDALSSAAYGPEAALSLLIPLGLLGVRYIVPISAAIITLLVIVYFSYRQTIEAYPTGGGSYTVARYNLGSFWGLLAAAALLADYILTAAVGISAGVGALISAVPKLLPHTMVMCLGILVVITIVNLRGVKDAGFAFLVPTYLFVGCLVITIAGGIVRTLLSGGHPAGGESVAATTGGAAGSDVLAVAARVCERLHGADRGGSSEQWSAGVPRAAGEKRATDVDDHYRDPGRTAGGDFVPGESVRDCGHGSGAAGIPERSCRC